MSFQFIAFCAFGKSWWNYVDDNKYIERGYEDFEDKLRKIGADIIKAECEKDVRKFEFSVS